MLALTVLLGAAMIVATAVPLVRKKDWWIRIFDFPRLQILVIAAVTLFVFLLLVEDWSAWHAAFALLLVLSMAYQAYMMYPYTFFARPKVRRASTRHVQRTIALVFANVLMTNRDSDELLAIIREEDPDIVLAVETDGWWERELDVLAETHPHVVRQPQNNTYGMLRAVKSGLGLASLPLILLAGWVAYALLFAGKVALLPFALIILAEVLGWRLVELVAIINNGFLGMVRQWQEFFYERRYAATPLSGPDFVKLAEAFGVRGIGVSRRGEVLPAVDDARSHAGPVVIDFRVEQEDTVYPMVPAGADLHAMIRRPNPIVETGADQ